MTTNKMLEMNKLVLFMHHYSVIYYNYGHP